MKKTYIKPELQVIGIIPEGAILSASDPRIGGCLDDGEDWD